MGTICHMLEDYGSPAHTVPGDNMFTLLQQFLPPPDRMKGKLLHGPIEERRTGGGHQRLSAEAARDNRGRGGLASSASRP